MTTRSSQRRRFFVPVVDSVPPRPNIPELTPDEFRTLVETGSLPQPSRAPTTGRSPGAGFQRVTPSPERPAQVPQTLFEMANRGASAGELEAARRAPTPFTGPSLPRPFGTFTPTTLGGRLAGPAGELAQRFFEAPGLAVEESMARGGPEGFREYLNIFPPIVPGLEATAGVAARSWPGAKAVASQAVGAGARAAKAAGPVARRLATSEAGAVNLPIGGVPTRITRFLVPDLQAQLEATQARAAKLGIEVDAIAGPRPDEWFVLAQPPKTGFAGVKEGTALEGKQGLIEWVQRPMRSVMIEAPGHAEQVQRTVPATRAFKNLADFNAFLDTGAYTPPSLSFPLRQGPFTPLYESGQFPRTKAATARIASAADQQARDAQIVAQRQAAAQPSVPLEAGAVGKRGRPRPVAGREAEIQAELKNIDRSEARHAAQYGRTTKPGAPESPNYGPAVSPNSPAGRSWATQDRNFARQKSLIAELETLRAAARAQEAAGQAALPVAGKEPWQMTLSEYGPIWVKEAIANARRANIYEGTEKSLRDSATLAHYWEVQRAVKVGKLVPTEVLAEYPDLAKAALPAETEALLPGVRTTMPTLAETRGTPAPRSPVTAVQPGLEPAPGAVRQGPAGVGPRAAAPAELTPPPAAAGPSPAAVQLFPPPFAEPPAVASPSAGGRPPTPPGPPAPPIGAVPPGVGGQPPEGFAANIRLSKYPEDIRATVLDWAQKHPEEIQAARRGVRTDADVLADAKSLAEDMGGDFSRLQRRWNAGDAWNAEEVTAIRGTLRAKTEAVMEAATAAKAQNSAANHARLLVALDEQARVQEIVHGVTAEAGRSLRAFRQEAFDAIGSNDTARLEELLRRIGGRERIDDIAGKIANLNLANPAAVNNFIRSVQKPSLWDYVMELYINSILSGPKTHIINELSNLVNAAVSPIERLGAAVVEPGVARLQGRRTQRFFEEVPADAFGLLQGLREGIPAALATLRDGITPTQATKWEFRRTAFKGKLGRVIRAPGTALEAADAMNYAMNYRAALNAGIIRQARSEGLKGLALLERMAELKANPVEALGTGNLMKEAARVAEYRLFRQPPGTVTKAILKLREIFPPLKFVVPFISTPVNLFKFGIERSPLGLFNPSLWRNLAGKSPEASDQLARVFLGSMLAGLIAWQFREGKITGAAPTNAAARDRFYREGKLPFAVKIGGKWVQYQRLEPFNQPIGQVAAAIEAMEQGDKSANQKVGAAAVTISTNLVSQTYLSGLSDFLNAVSAPERSGEAFLTRIGTGIVPASSALRTAAQFTDPTIRKPTTPVERLQTGVPGLSQRVPPVLTAFGEEAQRQSPAWSPIAVSSSKQSAVDAELGRLGIEVGFVGATIGGKELPPSQRRQYQERAGQLSRERLAGLFADREYPQWTEDRKRKAVRYVVDRARTQARRELLQTAPVQPTRAAQAPVRLPEPIRAPTPLRGPVPARQQDIREISVDELRQLIGAGR